MGIVKHTWVRRALVGALVVGLAALAVACGGSSESSTTTSSAPPATAPASTTGTSALTGEAATIAANWVKFFDGSVAPQAKIGLLESGRQYQKELETNAASPFAQSSTATVTAVTITSPTEATVKYTVLVGGQPALPDQTGKAIKQDGVWKVGAQSFLALLALQKGSATSTPASTPTT
jgi:hypothetical protein